MIGRFYDDVNAPGTSAIKNSGLYKYGENPGGINILDDPSWTWPINQTWLQDAINRGDIIRVASDPFDNFNIWVDGIVDGTRTTFGKEVELLEDLNYTFDFNTYTFNP